MIEIKNGGNIGSILAGKFVGHYKTIWLLVVLVVPVIGPIANFARGKKQKIRSGEGV